MPRFSRKSINSKYIHVITKGIKKEYIFDENKYKQYYINLLNKAEKEYSGLKILGYCIMDNHAHVLVYSENINALSKMMSKSNTSYAIFYNKVKNREGYVFQNRYYTQEIANENHLLNTLAYIHKNPVKAGMVNKEKDYKYSSYNKYLIGNMDEESVKLIFHTQKYKKQFFYIHRNFSDENIMDVKEDMQDSEEEIKSILKFFCQKHSTNLESIRKNNYLLMETINLIKMNYSATNKEIAQILGIGKNRICNINKKLNIK